MDIDPQQKAPDADSPVEADQNSKPSRGDWNKQRTFWGLAVCGALLDLVTKKLAFASCPPEGVVVIPHHFSLLCNWNLGGVFGVGQRSPWVFIALSVICIVVVYFFYRRLDSEDLLTSSGLGLILAGAIGNLYDRLAFGAVRDFLHFYWGERAWPTFNVADTLLCVGVGLCVLAIWRSENQAE